MPADRNVLAFVMAGGEGSRLYPLTARRAASPVLATRNGAAPPGARLPRMEVPA